MVLEWSDNFKVVWVIENKTQHFIGDIASERIRFTSKCEVGLKFLLV